MLTADLFASKTALVMGSTSGMGLKTAELLARSGARTVYLNGRDAAAGAEVCIGLAREYPQTKFEFIAADYSKPEELADLFAQVKSRGNGLDVFVHTCMSLGRWPMPFLKTDRDYWQDTLKGMFLSLLECCSHAVPMMLERGGGSIVSIASDGGKVPTPSESVLGAAMAAQVMFLKVLAIEVGRQGIRVNAVLPSVTSGTRSYDAGMAREHTRHMFESAAQKARLGVPTAEDVANTIVFLSSSLAKHVTGQAVSVNGGISVF